MRNRQAWLIGAAALILILGTSLVLWWGSATEASLEDARAEEAQRKGRGGSVWGEDYFPNVTLVSHEGEEFEFFDDMIKDKVVAINFIYTTCPDACPMETARLMEVQELLGGRVGQDVFFYSITIDPEHDTPEVLNRYVKNWGLGDGWKFMTGDEDDIVQLRKKLGVYIDEIQSEDSNDHNLSLIIGNQATGRWMKRSPYENPHVLATQLGSWLHNWKMASTEKRDYKDAPELRQISTGELVFRTRCASCHTIGEGDVARDQYRVGPDLLNVHMQRPRPWLERWIMEPDKMLEEEDPLAMALYNQYNQVPMPNLRMTPVDVENLLAYIEEASERAMADRPADPQMAHHGGMDHSQMDHSEMDHGQHGMDHSEMDHSEMDHSEMDHGQMDHGEMGHAEHTDHPMGH